MRRRASLGRGPVQAPGGMEKSVWRGDAILWAATWWRPGGARESLVPQAAGGGDRTYVGAPRKR
jgi:hypothetical protein